MEIAAYEREAFEQDIAQTLAHDMNAFARLSHRAGQRCHALVSAGQCGAVDEHRQEDSWTARLVAQGQLDATPLFLHTPEAAAAGVGPWLIELPAPREGAAPSRLLHDLAHGAGAVHALSLMASPLRPTALAAHLRSWLDGLIPADPAIADDEAVGAVVRWFDPRIGFDMVALWPEADRRDFLRAFTWAGWDVRFHPRGLPCSKPHAPASAERVAPMLLHKELLLSMVPLNQADELLAEVLEAGEAQAFAHIAPALLRWIALDQVQAAQRLGIADRDARLTLLHHSLSLHPGLPRVPGLQEWLAEAAGQGRTLAHVLDARPPGWWQRQRNAAPHAWAQWAHQFLVPLQARRDASDTAPSNPADHAFATLFPAVPAAA